ncbi:MAG: hypothetical protein IIY21_04275 [Clostridiales bacterium]|nr:hypothetical protein [Clostridiales bacterium]MBQ1573898.1 hypothetical protein [Clostridiales bacterium]
MDVQKFTGAVVSIVVVVILTVTVLVPIIADNQLSTGEGSIANAASINAILTIIPLLVVVGIIIAVIGMFLYKRK